MAASRDQDFIDTTTDATVRMADLLLHEVYRKTEIPP
jgi:hypothetical protein